MQIEKARTLYRGERDGLAGLIQTLADSLTKRGQNSFLRAVDGATISIDGDVAIRMDELNALYREAFRKAGRAEAGVIGNLTPDLTHPRTVRHLRERSATLITNTDDAVKESVRRVMSRGAMDGKAPEQMVRGIARVVGLSQRDATALLNFETGLRTQGLKPGYIANRVLEYERRLKKQRALVIARTEMTDAIEMARQEMWEQAVRAGMVARKNIWRTWRIRDEEACVICQTLDGARARLGGNFHRGEYDFGRPPAHPNCRCHVEYEATFNIVKHGGSSHDQKDHGNWARGGASGVPAAPGTSKLPPDHVRLYHYTSRVGDIDKIAEHGITLGTARGESYGEPNMTWASTRMPDTYAKEFVEFSLPMSEVKKAIIGGPSSWSTSTPEEWMRGYNDMGFGFDITTDRFIGIHKPWHGHYRYIMENPDVQAEIHDPLWKDHWDYMASDPEYGPAIELARKTIKKHAGPGPHPGTGTPQTVHGGQFSKPMIYVGADEVIRHGEGDEEVDWRGLRETSPADYPLNMGGKGFISPNDPVVGDEVYHVTTNLSSVAATGIIKASFDNEGLGGGRKDAMMVSLTVSKDVAEGIERDLKMVATMYEKLGLNPYDRTLQMKQERRIMRSADIDHEAVRAWNLSGIEFLEAEAKKQGWTYNSQYRYQHEHALIGDGSSSLLNDFFSSRSSWANDAHGGWPPPEKYRNPLFFTEPAQLATLRVDNIGMISVPRKALKTGAALMDFDIGNGALEEVSFFGDIVIETGITKHYGPGPHPGTNTPQKIHGQKQGKEPIGDVTEDFTNPFMEYVDPFIFTFRTPDDVEYNSIITDVARWGDDTIMVRGEIQADDGEHIAEWERHMSPEASMVYNARFKVDEEFQGEGIGLTWLLLTERNIAEAGYEKMKVTAVSIGQYAWAKYGYEWDDGPGSLGGDKWWAGHNLTITEDSPVYPRESALRWNQMVGDALNTPVGTPMPQPWEIAAIPVVGKRELLGGNGWSGVRDLTKIYGVEKMDSAAYNRLLQQWVDDGKAGLIESDDPSWFEAVAALQVKKHGDGSHDDKDHGNWADGDKRFGAGQRKSEFTNPDGSSMNRSRIGAIHEDLFVYLSDPPKTGHMAALHGPRYHAAGKGKHTNPIDVLMGEFAVEVKTTNLLAKNHKATMKAEEIERKYAEAKRLKRRPATIVQVVDQARRRVEVHFFPDEYAARSVNTRTPDWTYEYKDGDVEMARERAGDV